jgi:MFS family permease
LSVPKKLRGRRARKAAAADLACMYMGSTLVTPLYVLYQEEMGFSELVLTLIFAAYSAGNIASLFLLGRLSDQVGRRRMTVSAIAVAVLATLVFLFASTTAWLFAGRFLSGLAIGMASGAATAWVVDLTRERKEERGAATSTGSIFAGLAIAVAVAGVLAQYAPAPLQLPFVLYLAVLAVLAFFVSRTKDTVEDRAESLDEVSLAPRIGVPRGIRARFVSPAVTAFAVFAVCGFYAALTPSLLRRDMDVANLAIGGALVCVLFGAAAVTARTTDHIKSRMAMLSGAAAMVAGVALLVGAHMLQSLLVLAIGAVVTGIAAALGYRGSLQVINEIAPKARRAEVISTFMLICFTGNAVPVIGVGVIASVWSASAAIVSLAALVALLSVVALATELRRGRRSRR